VEPLHSSKSSGASGSRPSPPPERSGLLLRRAPQPSLPSASESHLPSILSTTLTDSSPSRVPPRRFLLDPPRQGGLLSYPMLLDEDGALAILLTARCSRLTSDATAWSRLTPILPLTYWLRCLVHAFFASLQQAHADRLHRQLALVVLCFSSCSGRALLWFLALCDVLCFGSKMGFAAGAFCFGSKKQRIL
jgi:hypothetical protein